MTLFIFLLLRVLPGNIAYLIYGESTTLELAALVEQKLGLNEPLHQQYVTWLGDVVRLDLRSFFGDRPVMDVIRVAFPVSLNLAAYTMVMIIAFSVPIGVLAALRRDTWIDHSSMIFAVLGLSMPTFWVGILLLYGLMMLFSWAPPFSWVSPFEDPLRNFSQMIWPSLTLAWVHLATIARMTRSAMLETLNQDYVITARAKGLSPPTVVWRHALRNALIPIVTLAGIQMAKLLGGSIVVERVFNVRGVGWYLIQSVQTRDYAVVEGLIMFIAVMVLTINLLIDLLYSRLDPRISYR